MANRHIVRLGLLLSGVGFYVHVSVVLHSERISNNGGILAKGVGE